MSPIFSAILPIVNKFFSDKDAANKLALELEREYTKQMEMQHNIIRKEQDMGGFAAKWRPITAMIFVLMIVLHFFMYDVFPWMRTVFDWNIWVPQDPGYTEGLMEVVKLCLGGYIFSRSVEKGIKFWRK